MARFEVGDLAVISIKTKEPGDAERAMRLNGLIVQINMMAEDYGLSRVSSIYKIAAREIIVYTRDLEPLYTNG